MPEIKNVSDWAFKAGYSRSWLSRKIKKCTGKTANCILKEYRFRRLVREIYRNPLATSCCIADKIAPWDERRLYNFLNHYYDTNFSILRLRVITNFTDNVKKTHIV
ncbi:MAG: hypothetical protein ABJM22_12730 [Balneola sp.]